MRRAPGSTAPEQFYENQRGDDEIMEIQMGPSHPASHGTVKFNLKLDGETIVEVDVEVGYLPPRLREDVRAGDVEPLLPVRRPPELREPAPEQRRLRARGREARRASRRPSAASTSASSSARSRASPTT
jgi:hypothetical protein